jgi:hypothetical protein
MRKSRAKWLRQRVGDFRKQQQQNWRGGFPQIGQLSLRI